MQTKIFIILLAVGLVPLVAARVAAQHGGASNHPTGNSRQICTSR